MRRAICLQMGGACLALFLAVGQASAADPKFLGYLAPNQAGQLWAYPDASGNWCREATAMSVLLTPRLDYAQVVSRLHAIGLQLAKSCKAADSAKVAVYNADRSIAGPSIVIRKADNWLAASAAPPPSPQPAESPAAPAPVAAAPAPQPSSSPTTTAAEGTPSPSPTASSSPSEPAPVLPRETNYNGALLAFLHATPALTEDNGILRYWASYRFARDYQQFANQEFKLQPILQQAKTDLAATMAQTDGRHVTAVIPTQFGAYDFNSRHFPITLNMQELSVNKPCCLGFPNLPNGFVLKIADLDVVDGLPMDPDSAQSFAEKRTRWGNVNRNILVAVTIRLDEAGFEKDSWGRIAGVGTLEGAAIYADERTTQPLFQISGSELDQMRAARATEKAAHAKAEAERQAEQRRQQLVAQRDQFIRGIADSPASVKLANWISNGQIDYASRLNNLRAARAAALIGGKAVPVRMLVQMDTSGRNRVETKWPGKLQITLADGQPDLQSSGWYLVQGLLTVPDAESVPSAELAAKTVYSCTQPKCAEATDATALVDRKIAALGEIR